MKRLSLSCAAVAACVSVLAGVGPVGWASAAEEPEARSLAVKVPKTLGFYFHVADGISLGIPTVINKSGIPSVEALTDEGGGGAGYRVTYESGWGSTPEPVQVAWPIHQAPGGRTGKTLTCRTARATECWVMERDTHFHAYLNQRGLDNDWDVHLTDDRVDRWAEASGAIRAEGPVSLEGGKFTTESALRVDGASAVSAGRSTQFDAVLTPGDQKNQLDEPDTARMKFTYELRDNGKPANSKWNGTRLSVKGDVSNEREQWKFQGGSSCEIVDLFDIADPGYTCTMKSAYPYTSPADGRVHYITDFTVSKVK
jgi:hypothetical protein